MVIGIDLGGTNIRIGQISNNCLVNKYSAASPSKMALDESIEYLKSIIKPFISSDAQGIGIGVPSVLDPKKGIVYNVANIPSWKEVHLKDILEREFNLPVYINNDSNCFALGEKYFGQGREFDSIVGITLGTGVGAGIVIGDNLVEGSNTGAGEIGCIKYLESNYEHYCSSEYFTTYYNITGAEAAKRAMKNDQEAIGIWEEFGCHIGQLVQVILFAYDPNAIIIGGGIANAFPLYSESMYKTMKTFPYPKTLDRLQIRVSNNPDIAILGAAALVK